jgi:hypothetical protein
VVNDVKSDPDSPCAGIASSKHPVPVTLPHVAYGAADQSFSKPFSLSGAMIPIIVHIFLRGAANFHRGKPISK